MRQARDLANRLMTVAWIHLKDDKGESHLIAMLVVTAAVAAAAVAFRGQIQGWFTHYSNDLGSP
jgi:hypothetical protein